MNTKHGILFMVFAIVVVVINACASDGGAIDTGEEESGAQLVLNETYDAIRNGARLVLNYDKQSNTFIGYVENSTDKPLVRVRVEVHLSNGDELGPTTPVDLDPGERVDISLAATTGDFDGWTAHPEVGGREGGEHGEGEGESEHGEEGGDGHSEGDSD